MRQYIGPRIVETFGGFSFVVIIVQFFEIGYHYAIQAGLSVTILLP
jgi:hypothetical protein